MNKIITISREYGAGGHSVAKLVAEQLGISFYDWDIMRETVKASGYEKELVEQEEEEISKGESFWKSIANLSNAYYKDTQDAIHEVQKTLMLKYAQEGPCIIVGRCADEVMREYGIPSLNVFIHADAVHRAIRLSKMTGITDATELEKMMERKDTSRRNYYSRYTGKKWGDCHNYHLTLDSGVLGDEFCAKIIVEAAGREP